jgi:hypothetical protein
LKMTYRLLYKICPTYRLGGRRSIQMSYERYQLNNNTSLYSYLVAPDEQPNNGQFINFYVLNSAADIRLCDICILIFI